MVRISNQTKRIQWIDEMKGFLILCVVLGHIADGYLKANTFPEIALVLRNLNNVIYSFHMPLFFLVSGFVFSRAYLSLNGISNLKRVSKAIINNICIYVFLVFCGGYKLLFSKYANTSISGGQILAIWGKPLDLYWYLYVLIFYYFLLYLLKVLIKKE
ncbi:MAG: acyltransferase family protein [Lachnospiraceae bacterium]|nr:acyltransferase family protein [Lachnospiraceae bacterium]